MPVRCSDPKIQLLALGAGKDVGRSCIVATIGDRRVMFDCGAHLSFRDHRRFPDFSLLATSSGRLDLTQSIDCLVVTHFHLDHCGALPVLTEQYGYRGPIFMTHPTKAICPMLLDDYRRIGGGTTPDSTPFTSQEIRSCIRRVTVVNIHESVFLGRDFEIRAYYAGHVLGAAMFFVRVGTLSVLYTGDFNATPDRHLGSAWVPDRLRPTVLITEATYATTLRDSRRARERSFLERVHEAVARGGKVLVPVFALGRAQELCLLLDAYWTRAGLGAVPIYFGASGGMTARANAIYRIFLNWTNQRLRRSFRSDGKSAFELGHVRAMPSGYAVADAEGPMVVFSSPGMLHSGPSLALFRRWAGDERNLLILPGYCAPGTIGARLLAGQRKFGEDLAEVKMQVECLSFSAHSDALGIAHLVQQCEPENVVLVHGEAVKMELLRESLEKRFEIPCFVPANGEELVFKAAAYEEIAVSDCALKRYAAAAGLGCPLIGFIESVASDQVPKFRSLEEFPIDKGLEGSRFVCKSTLKVEPSSWKSVCSSASAMPSFLASHFKGQLRLEAGQLTLRSCNLRLTTGPDETLHVAIEWDYLVR